MQPLVRGWLGHNDDLYRDFFNQTLLYVKNKWTDTSTIRNPLRAAKPKQKRKGDQVDPWTHSQNILKETKEGCNFCNEEYKKSTAQDTFGRIETVPGIHTAANSFRFADFHTILFPTEHDPFSIDITRFGNWFQAARIWFKLVHSQSSKHDHPMLLWDAMPHAGASQVHPHMHAVIGKGEYMGKYLHLDQVARRYDEEFGRKYLSDYVDVHVALGLGLKVGTAAVVSPLDGWKDHEFVIIADDLNDDFVDLFFDVYRVYVEELSVFCWSSGIALPSLSNVNKSNIGAVARISSRGNCQSEVSDVSSLDLYTFFSVDTDPTKTLSAFQLRANRKSDLSRGS